MSSCLAFYTAQSSTFKKYGTAHMLALLLTAVTSILIVVFKKRITHKADKIIRLTASISAIGAEINQHVWNYVNKNNFWGNLFCLDLCHITTFLSLFLNFFSLSRGHKMHPKVFSVVYFWSAGAIVALLFPTLEYGPKKARFYHFFWAHIFIVLTALYCLFIDKYKINFKSYLRAIVVLIVVAAIVGAIDVASGQNYMFLSGPGNVETPLNALGTGAIYYVNLFLLALVSNFLLFIPHIIKNTREKRQLLTITSSAVKNENSITHK